MLDRLGWTVEHIGSEQLALIALGKQVPGQVQHHVDSCPQCADELEALRAIVATDTADPGPVVTNPLWALPEEDRSTRRDDDEDPDDDAFPPPSLSTTTSQAPGRTSAGGSRTTSTTKGPGRWAKGSPWMFVGVAVVIGLILVGLGTAWWLL